MKRYVIPLASLLITIIAQAQIENSAWPKAHGTLSNSGLSTGSGAMNVLKWKFYVQTQKNFLRSPIVGMDGTVYIAATDGSTYSLNPDDGSVKWTAEIGASSLSSPALCADGRLFVGTDAGNLYALDSTTGGVIWVVTPNATQGQAMGPPTIGSDGTIYVASQDGFLYALNGTDGLTKWAFNIGTVAPGELEELGCASFGADGTIYIAGGSTVYALDKTGDVKWSLLTSGTATTNPVVGSDGTVYVGASDGKAYALDGTSGTVKWTYTSGAAISSSPTIGPKGDIYICSQDANVYDLDPASGTVKWYFTSASPIYASAAVDGNGVVYVPSSHLYMYVLDGSSGYPEWEFATNEYVFEPAIGGDGSLYVPSGDGYLYAFLAGIYPTSLVLNPSSVVLGESSTGTLTISSPAPAGGITVSLSSDLEGVTVPNSVTVLAGQRTASFPIKTPYEVVAQFHANISATYKGITVSAVLTLEPLAITTFTIAPSPIPGGNSATGTLTLNGNAPPTGADVSLTSNSAAVIPPGSITVAGGQSTATFQIPTVPVSSSTYTIVSASLSGTKPVTAYLIVSPAQLLSLTFDPPTVAGGDDSIGTLTMTGPAPAGGLKATFSNPSADVYIPLTLQIPAGKASVTFTAHTTQVKTSISAIIVATVGTISHAATLTVTPPTIVSVTLKPASLSGGASSDGTVTLSGPAGRGGLRVRLTSDTKTAALPDAVTVPFNKTTASFTIRTEAVKAQTVATISGITGSTTVTAGLTILAPTLESVTISPNSVQGGHSATGKVKLTSKAPVGGFEVTLSSSSGMATVVTKMTVPAGETSGTFTVKTVKVSSSTSATITASSGGVAESATLGIT